AGAAPAGGAEARAGAGSANTGPVNAAGPVNGANRAGAADPAGGADPTGNDSLASMLRRSGLKLTPQRHLICRLIENSAGHPTAEELYEAATQVMPSMSLKTVYTTLNDLAALNAIRLVNVGTGGFRVESNLEPHGHLVCRMCGTVMDVPVHPAIEEELSVPP